MSETEFHTLSDYVKHYLSKYSSLLFLREIEGREVTYQEAQEEIVQIQHLLKECGIKKGDKVALLGNNSINWALVHLATVSYGAIIVPILSNFSSSNVHNILDMSEAKVAFVSAPQLNKLEGVSFPSLEKSFILEDFSEFEIDHIPDLLEKIKKTLKKIKTKAATIFTKNGKSTEMLGYKVEEDDLASIIYTSGTTGKSKGVMLSHCNLLSNAMTIDGICKVTEADRLLSILPLAHTFECTVGLLAMIQTGCSVHYIEGKPTPKRLLQLFNEVKPTLVLVVPLIMEKIYFKRVKPQLEKNLVMKGLTRLPFLRAIIYRKAVAKLKIALGGQLRHLIFGGAPINPEVESFMQKGDFSYFMGYGMTECSPLITALIPDSGKFQSCGQVVKDVTVMIDSPNSETGIGEILTKGPNVTCGYYMNPEATRELFTGDGWLRTGDLGYMDSDEFLYIKGRSKNMILGASGENIYPEEIEQLLNKEPGVLESLVISRDNRLLAFIVPDYDVLRQELKLYHMDDQKIRGKIEQHLDGIIKSINRHVPDFSRVSNFEIMDRELEKTPTEKIKRYLYQ